MPHPLPAVLQTSNTPAARVIRKLGGFDVAADLAGRHPRRLYEWLKPRKSGGTGGAVPMSAQLRMVANAKKRGIALVLEEFAPRNGEVVE
jgi:hypothetical protein